MKWQGDGLHKQHPPWIDINPTVYSAVGQVLLVFSSPERPQWIFEYHNLFKFSVTISTLQHLVGSESSCLQGKTKQKREGKKTKQKMPLSCVSSVTLTVCLKRLSDLIACQIRAHLSTADVPSRLVGLSTGLR